MTIIRLVVDLLAFLPLLITPLFFAVVIGGIIWSVVNGRKVAAQRTADVAALANHLGMQFQPGPDSTLDDKFSFLRALAKGHSQSATNMFWGNYRGHDVTSFDYRYVTGSGKNREVHSSSVMVLTMPNNNFPELLISPQYSNFGIAKFFGIQDIDFESPEFNESFKIKSRDKKFAFHIIGPQMMEYLIANKDLTIEIENRFLTISFRKQLDVPFVHPNLDRIVQVRELIPDYVVS